GLREGAHAWQHDAGGLGDRVVVVGDDRRGPHVPERLLHRAQVAHAVVEDSDPGSAHRSPFVDGMPGELGSIATAARSARAKALKLASTMWCVLLPASICTCRVSFALLATARKNSSARS